MGSNQSNVTVPLWDPQRQIKLQTYAEFEDDWFEQGASRYAYQGVYHTGGKDGRKCVVKLYKQDYTTKLGESAFLADARTSLKSSELANRFNFDVPTNKPIHFLIPTLAKLKEASNFKLFGLFPFYKNVKGKLPGTTEAADVMLPSGATLAIEDFLEGNYVKFLSNASWVNTTGISFGPAAFAHYTYHITEGQLLVCDLQGVRESSQYLLTDPAIHDGKNGPNFYGPTDLGVAGIVRFFCAHECNDMCRRFIRPNVDAALQRHHLLQRAMQVIQPRHSSTYTYELEQNGVSLAALRNIPLSIIAE